MPRSALEIPVLDPFGAAGDPLLPSLPAALDPEEVQAQLAGGLPRLSGEDGAVSLEAIRVIRHKPGRRCLVAYDVAVERPGLDPESATILGKVRRRRYGHSGYRLLDALWRAGFDGGSADGLSVPEPLGTIGRFRMLLQREVPGVSATHLLASPQSEGLAVRISEAAHKLHRTGVPPEGIHTIEHELAILQGCLTDVARLRPAWTARLERLFAGCERLALRMRSVEPVGIHRDFYADQVLVDEDRLYLVDFDLYTAGDPALDIGNFLGHVTEQSLRVHGNSQALAHVEGALEERFLELEGKRARPRVRTYAALTLARHVYLSWLAGRYELAAELLDLSEERVALAGGWHGR